MGVAAMALSALASLASAQRGLRQKATRAQQVVRADQERFAGSRIRPTNRRVSNPGKTHRTFPARAEEAKTDVFVRLPRQGVAKALRRHNLMRMLADQIGMTELVPPAARLRLEADIGDGAILLGNTVREVRRGTEVMVVEDVGAEFIPFRELSGDSGWDAEMLSAVPEEMRIVGATLHLLTRQADGNSTNILVRTDSRPLDATTMRLIDHDVSLGVKHTGPKIRGSFFFPGRPLGYESEQSRFDHLPSALQELVSTLSEASAKEIARTYDLRANEAELLRSTARLIRERGLTASVKQFRSEFSNYHAPRSPDGDAGGDGNDAAGQPDSTAAVRLAVRSASRRRGAEAQKTEARQEGPRTLGSVYDASLAQNEPLPADALLTAKRTKSNGQADARGYLSQQQYEELRDGVVELVQRFPPDRYFYLGLGRSPTAIVAFLENLGAALALTVPGSGLKTRDGNGNEQTPQLDQSWTEHLRQFLPDRLLAELERQGRTILTFDRATTGDSLATFAGLLQSYVSQSGRNVPVEMVAFATRKVPMGRIKLRNRGELRLINKYEPWSEWPKYNVGSDGSEQLVRRAEYDKFKQQLLERMKRDPALEALAATPLSSR